MLLLSDMGSQNLILDAVITNNGRRIVGLPNHRFQGLATRRHFPSTFETEWDNSADNVARLRRRTQNRPTSQQDVCKNDVDDTVQETMIPVATDVTFGSWAPAGTCAPTHHHRIPSSPPIVDPDTFPYPDPFFPDSESYSRFFDRLSVLARLESDTKRQEDRRSASAVSGRRSAFGRRRPGERLVSAGPRRVPQETRQRPRTAVMPSPSPQPPPPPPQQQHRQRPVPQVMATSVSSVSPRPRTCPPEASRGAGAQLPRGTGRPVPNTAATGRAILRRSSPSSMCSALLRLDFADPSAIANTAGSLRKFDDHRRRQESQTVISLQYIGGGRTVPHPQMMASMRPSVLGPPTRGNVDFIPIRHRPLLRSPATYPSGGWSVQLRQK